MLTKTESLKLSLSTLNRTWFRLKELGLTTNLLDYEILRTEKLLAFKPDPYAWYDPFD